MYRQYDYSPVGGNLNTQEERTTVAAPTGEATQQRPRPTTRTRRTTGQNRRATVKADGERPNRPRPQGDNGERRQSNRVHVDRNGQIHL